MTLWPPGFDAPLVVALVGEGAHHKILVLQLFYSSVKGRVHLDSIPHILYIFIHFPPLPASPVLFEEGSLTE